MASGKTIKDIESIVEKIIERKFGDLKNVPREKIYQQTLDGQQLNKKIAIYKGRDKEPETKKVTLNILKKVRQEKNKYFLFIDMPRDEYFVRGKRLDLGMMEASLLYYFTRDIVPQKKTVLDIYVGVWKEGDQDLPVKDSYKKSVEELLARLRKKVGKDADMKGTEIFECWSSPMRRESIFGLNPELSYCVIFD